MSDLPAALDAALRDRYPIAGPKRPATHRQGLTARMKALEKLFTRKGEREGAERRRAAEAAGISPRTWQKWRANTQKPSAALLRKLETAVNRLVTLPDFRRRLKAKTVPNRVKVTATIRWSSSPGKKYNRQAYRTTTLESMRPVMAKVIHAWATAGPHAAAEAFERGASQVYSVPDDEDGGPGIRFEGDAVIVEFLEGEH